MNKSLFLAKDDGESIEEHTQRLVLLFEGFCRLFYNKLTEKQKKLILLAIKYHDLGKMNSSFQAYIYKKMGKKVPDEFGDLSAYKNILDKDIPHGILSAAFIDEETLTAQGFDMQDIYLLVTAVSNHHVRSLQNRDSQTTIDKVIDDDLCKNAELYGMEYCDSYPVCNFNFLGSWGNITINNKPVSDLVWTEYAVIKGMLNKADYAASAKDDCMEIVPADAKAMTLVAMENKKFGLRPCQEYLLEHQNENIIMRASTGMGKTEAALIWAGEEKTFYTLPFKVSIDAIYKRIKDDSYYPADKLALLHSGALSALMEEENLSDDADQKRLMKKYDAIKNLSYPFTVCTVDQLFLFAFKANGTEILAATLCYSKIIIDEIQAYEPELLAKILYGLTLVQKFGCKFLIMTATLAKFIYEYLNKEIKDLKVDEPFYTQKIRHIPCLKEGEIDINDIRCHANKKVLVICNTVGKAQEIFNKLKESGLLAELLHSRFIQKDRAKKEKDIKYFAESNDRGIWVCTQLVEASLDIDFDILFTEMSTADSLLQRMGRCWRKREEEYNSSEPNIVVYDSRNGVSISGNGIYDADIYQRSLNCLQKYCNRPFSEYDKQIYVDEVYDTEQIKSTQYYKKFCETINSLKNNLSGKLSKENALKDFRHIEGDCVIPWKYYETTSEIYERIEATQDKKQRMHLNNELQSYTLNVNLRGGYSKLY